MICKQALLIGILSTIAAAESWAISPENQSAFLLTEWGHLHEANLLSGQIVSVSIPDAPITLGSGPGFDEVFQVIRYGEDALLALKSVGIVHVDLTSGDRTQWVADDVDVHSMNWYSLGPDNTLYGFRNGRIVTIDTSTGERTDKAVISKSFKTGVVDANGTVWATSQNTTTRYEGTGIFQTVFGYDHNFSVHRIDLEAGVLAESWENMNQFQHVSTTRSYHHTGMIADGNGDVQSAFYSRDTRQFKVTGPLVHTYASRICTNETNGVVSIQDEAIVGIGLSASGETILLSQDARVWEGATNFQLEVPHRIKCAIIAPAFHTILSGEAAIPARQLIAMDDAGDDLNDDQILDAADVVARGLSAKQLVGN